MTAILIDHNMNWIVVCMFYTSDFNELSQCQKKHKCIIGKVQSYDDINYKFWIKLRPIKNGILKRSLIAKKSTTILESSLTFLKNKHWFYETNRYFLEALFWRERDTTSAVSSSELIITINKVWLQHSPGRWTLAYSSGVSLVPSPGVNVGLAWERGENSVIVMLSNTPSAALSAWYLLPVLPNTLFCKVSSDLKQISHEGVSNYSFSITLSLLNYTHTQIHTHTHAQAQVAELSSTLSSKQRQFKVLVSDGMSMTKQQILLQNPWFPVVCFLTIKNIIVSWEHLTHKELKVLKVISITKLLLLTASYLCEHYSFALTFTKAKTKNRSNAETFLILTRTNVYQ